LNFKAYDLVISSSGAEAKGINVPKGTLHLAYIHAPTHYYWSRCDDYLRNPGFGSFNWLARAGLKLLVGPLRKWDYKAAQKADYLLANSSHTQAAVKRYYDRESIVVHPPVDTERFAESAGGSAGAKPAAVRKGFVITGRQTPYKRVDLAVKACSELNLPLTVIGNGPEHNRLRRMAGPSVDFKGFVEDKEVARLIASAQAFIFPGVDDFGIAPVEAMAAGTPVIAYKAGGALDYVHAGTGSFFEEQTVESLKEALQSFEPDKYSPEDIKKAARMFSNENFSANMRSVINKII
jgi:glycosyltransferase involved in cell wall biosynthesis